MIDPPAFPTLEEMAELLPQYEFHNVLGVGGMGAVYLARQATLDRWVAIKMLPVSAAQNEEDAQRFITEARSMARLSHANIVAVYDFGQTAQGHLYLVMEYVDGLDLHRLIHSEELPAERIRSLVPQICDALEYAHTHGIVHRDIKPANILITSNWQPKIVDFGLAKDKNQETGDASEYGTPDYAAPERLQPDAQVDHRADIYSLGVVIHEMFTKLTPRGAGAAAGQGLPPEYASIVSRCMMTDPARRFQRCGEIKAFLNAATIAAKAPAPAAPVHRPPPAQLQARIRQPGAPPVQMRQGGMPGWVWAAACLALLAAAGGWYVKQQQSSSGPNAPQTQAASNSAASSESANLGKAVPPSVISDSPAGPFKPPAGDFSVLKRLTGHREMVYASAVLPDQRRAISGGHDDTLIMWDVATGAAIKRFPSPVGDIHGIEAASDGHRVLLYSMRTQQVAVFDLDEGKTLASIKAPDNRLTLATWAADQKSAYLLCNKPNGGVYVWDLSQDGVLKQFSEWPRAAYSIITLPAQPPANEPQLLVVGSTMKPNPNLGPNSNQPLVMDKPWAALFTEPGHRIIKDLPDYTSIRNRMSLSPDGTTVLAGQGSLFLLDVPALTTRFMMPVTGNIGCSASAWAAAGRLVIAAYSDGSLRIREAETGVELASLKIELRANSIKISQDESWLLVSAFPMDVKNPGPNDFDVLVIRLPELNNLGSDQSFRNLAKRQNAMLEKFDPELAALRKKAVPSDSLANDEQVLLQIQDLTSKYGAALKRTAATAPPNDQQAMLREADAIAAGQSVPGPATDSATTGEHKRLRGIYRQQIAQMEQRRSEALNTAFKSLEAAVQPLSTSREQSRDRMGQARCAALLASLAMPKSFSAFAPVSVAESAVEKAPAAPKNVAAVTPPVRQPTVPIPAASAPKAPFANNVRLEVAIGRPSKIEGGDLDDEMQVMNPRVKLTNNSTSQSYDGYTVNFMLLGESTIDMKVFKVLQRVDFAVSLPVRQTFENKLPTVTTQYDTTGAKFGYKYSGWVVQVLSPQGEIVFTKSTSASVEKLPDLVKTLKADQCYDKKLSAVGEPVLRF
ncbi:serine/threonine protein kinase [Prosthecobacter vanneervenii]|uniref:Serine/threonine protein kinase n=2 Tax=Prosthecobacter vanneervenii TaxID=48466 RepID=A0A7W7YBR1_9BACT|nr:serine/threonine protein kinase [Prosthecobacter vanneervenii]